MRDRLGEISMAYALCDIHNADETALQKVLLFI
jgi:hypothetical protein